MIVYILPLLGRSVKQIPYIMVFIPPLCYNVCNKPEGFCQSAWDTRSPFVLALSHGAENFYDGWMKDPKSAMLSCNDGFRPVSFLAETLDEDTD